MQRRALFLTVPMAWLAGCGFKLRGSQSYGFKSLAVLPNPGGAVAAELRRAVGAEVRVLDATTPMTEAQLVLDIIDEQREKVAVGVSSAGQVREFNLRIRVRYKLRTPQDVELLPATELVLQRGFSFNESAVLAKEAEEALLYKDMQADIVQQLLRRLAAVKLP